MLERKSPAKLAVLAMLVLVPLLIWQLPAAAQTRNISGKVVNDKNEPVEGAVVTVKGTDINTTTDVTGSFKVPASPNATLIISYVGFITREINAGNNATLLVNL